MDKIAVNQVFAVIGDKKLKKLVDVFYDKIDDSILNHMFPENKAFGKKFQYLFLKQIFGGEREYEKFRGHPMMRKRHLPFKIGWEERNEWIRLMYEAMDEVEIEEEVKPVMKDYFDKMATKMINKETGKFALNVKL